FGRGGGGTGPAGGGRSWPGRLRQRRGGDAAWLADSRPADAAAHRRGERGRGEDLQAEPGGVPASGLPRRTGIGADLARVGERLGRAWREVGGAEGGGGASLAARALGRGGDRRARRGGRAPRRSG